MSRFCPPGPPIQNYNGNYPFCNMGSPSQSWNASPWIPPIAGPNPHPMLMILQSQSAHQQLPPPTSGQYMQANYMGYPSQSWNASALTQPIAGPIPQQMSMMLQPQSFYPQPPNYTVNYNYCTNHNYTTYVHVLCPSQSPNASASPQQTAWPNLPPMLPMLQPQSAPQQLPPPTSGQYMPPTEASDGNNNFPTNVDQAPSKGLSVKTNTSE